MVIENEYRNKLPTAQDDFIRGYNKGRGYLRYGISIKGNDDNTLTWICFDDLNENIKFDINSYTSYGVISTIFNFESGIVKPFYENFSGCVKSEFGQLVRDIDALERRFKFKIGISKPNFLESRVYLIASRTYSNFLVLFILDNSLPRVIYLTNRSIGDSVRYTELGSDAAEEFEKYAIDSDNDIYLGVKYERGLKTIDEIKNERGLKTIDEIKNESRYIDQVGNWFIFDRNDHYYLVINSANNGNYSLEVSNLNITYDDYLSNNPFIFYVGKSDNNIRGCKTPPTKLVSVLDRIVQIKSSLKITSGGKKRDPLGWFKK